MGSLASLGTIFNSLVNIKIFCFCGDDHEHERNSTIKFVIFIGFAGGIIGFSGLGFLTATFSEHCVTSEEGVAWNDFRDELLRVKVWFGVMETFYTISSLTTFLISGM